MNLWAFTRHLFLFSQNCNGRFFLLFNNIEFWHFRKQKFRANSTLQQSFCGRISTISSSEVAKSILYISKTLLLVPALRYTLYYILYICVICLYFVELCVFLFYFIILAFSNSRAGQGTRNNCCDNLTPFHHQKIVASHITAKYCAKPTIWLREENSFNITYLYYLYFMLSLWRVVGVGDCRNSK